MGVEVRVLSGAQKQGARCMPSGDFVFIVAGEDSNAGAAYPFSRMGREAVPIFLAREISEAGS